MKRLRSLLVAVALTLGALGFMPSPASAACGSIPFSFTNGVTIVDATQTNANNNFLLSCATQVDNTQIGPNGIFPSQLKGTTVGNNTFGGIIGYTIAVTSPSQVGLTIVGATAQTADIFDVNLVGGTNAFKVGSGGVATFGFSPVFSSGISIGTSGTDAGATAFRLGSAGATGGFSNVFVAAGVTVNTVAATLLGIGDNANNDAAFSISGNLGLRGGIFAAGGTLSSNLTINGSAQNDVTFGGGGFIGAAGASLEIRAGSSSGSVFVTNNANSVNNVQMPDGGGIQALRGDISANLGRVKAASDATTPSFVPPVYTPAGAALASTTHCVIGNTTTSAGGTATVTLSGAAAFASAGSYQIIMTPANANIFAGGSPLNATSFTISTTNISGVGSAQSVSWMGCGS